MQPFIYILGRSIPMYGLCIAVGIIASFSICLVRVKAYKLDVNSLFVIGAAGVGLGLIGAKIVYIFTAYDAKSVWLTIQNGDFSMVTEGGLVFYGGLIGGIAGGVAGVFVAKEQNNLNAFCNLIVPSIPLAHAFGRIGCFFAGCCYGIQYDGIFAVSMRVGGVYKSVFPTQLLEAILNLLIFVLLIIYSDKRRDGYKTLSIYLMVYSIARFLVEQLRGDEIRGTILFFSTSQFISLVLFLFGFAMYASVILMQNRRNS